MRSRPAFRWTETCTGTTGTAHADAVTSYCEAIRAAGGEPVFYEMGWGKSERAAVATELARFQPEAYQAKMAKWMFPNMAANLTHILDEPTPIDLEVIGWEESQRIPNCLTRPSRNGIGDRDRQRIKIDSEWFWASSAVSFHSLSNPSEHALE